MATTQLITVCKDSVTFTLNAADLTGMPVGGLHKTPERDVPRSDGLKWNVSWCPAGFSPEHAHHLSVFLDVNKAVTAMFNFKVNNSFIQSSLLYNFIELKQFGFYRLAHHADLRPLFVNGQLSITCYVEFNLPVSFTHLVPRTALYSDHVPTDFELIIDSNRLQIHKSLLSLISPVFHAMLSNDTAESRSGRLEITDFDVETVKTAIDFCYGREMETHSVETIFEILRFADKYDIKAVTSLVEKMPQQSLSILTFSAIIRYANDFFKDDLFNECCEFFKVHQKEIVETEKFTMLAPTLVARLLKQAFDLETEFDVLRHAHGNGATFILESLEPPILESLSLETFCDTVSYAWDCSRDSLKTACAKFFNEQSANIINMQPFGNLAPSVVQGVIKLRCDMFLADK
uniref:BTB domain-containing protein n=1 Tax=Panagrellus redivivus TaxID=6233 RepID=A0A7E4ZPR7_PANRE